MRIDTFYQGVEIHREDKIIYARFLKPHEVLSTCRVAGGLRPDLHYLYNHQSCEPAGHCHRLPSMTYRDPAAYRRAVCAQHGLPDEDCATLGTAANMRNACIAVHSFRDLTVAAVCTGGVEGNAGRAGDPASVAETADGFERLPPATVVPGPGTINTMLFIDKPLIPGALVRCIMTATEAKTAVLQELAVNSRYSDGLATGTGTDQIGVAAMCGDGPALTSAGKHAKLGELIGLAVAEAIKGTLARQNNLTPAGQCSVKIHLERFGITRAALLDGVCALLDHEQAELLRHNFHAIERDPLTVAAIAALAHLKDKIAWGVLPQACWSEIMASFGVQTACAVSGDYGRLDEYRRRLAPDRTATGNSDFIALACRALALGFADKWRTMAALCAPIQNRAEKENADM
ncbi:MAG: adenosylcobinamide amidohydrolase [Desulfobulbus sp.]|jgi:adenosylcobinamide amidohydrolase|uniref:adenosylcobinamide amidohydrolase n=1 Tax=Desulfobulbus sp. TaxID=895 RepID=UPI00283C401E|nr:adenosylcobinamide amidohydrolase [Desulfobulbus sp.]MDR2549784.1 adenosylcobinamide amidohydrolase [Desulfobulbus sp.]